MIRKSIGPLALVIFLLVGLGHSALVGQKTFTPMGIAKGPPSRTPQGRGRTHHLGVMKWGKGEVVVDTIQYCNDKPSVPVIWDPFTCPNDSVWWQFRPVAEGTLMAVEGCFHTSGRAKVYVCHFLRDSCYYLMENDVPGRNPNLLPQELFWNVTGNDSIWQTMDFMAYPGLFHIPIAPDTSYVIGCRLDYQGNPYINLDDPLISMRTTRDHDWRLSWCGNTVCCGQEGWECLCDSPNPVDTCRTAWYYIYYLSHPPTYPYIMLRAIVMYTPPIRPFLEGMDQLMDSYLTEVNAQVEAQLRDLDGTVTRARLYWRVNGGLVDSTDMELTGGKFTEWTATGHIIGSFSYGDTVWYWCYGWDNDGMKSVWNGPGSEVKRFIIREPNYNANILLVNDFGTESGERFYKSILDSHRYPYSYWSVSDYNGIDNSVVEAGNWRIAIIFGQGATSLPGRDYTSDNLWVPFLESGTAERPHNILYIDQGYFCAHPEYGCDFDSLLGPGEFLYDYFGVGSGFSETHDTLFFFMDHTTGGPFYGQELPIYPDTVDGASRTDFTRPRANAFPLFFAAIAYDTCGVRYETPTFKTVFLPFLLEAAVDPVTKEPSARADTLIHRILLWFSYYDAVQEVSPNPQLPGDFALEQNYPNPFNSTTLIRYTVPAINHQPSAVSLRVYNILGEEVRTLVDEEQGAGSHQILWDGRDKKGHQVASGIYLFRLKVGKDARVRKAVLLR